MSNMLREGKPLGMNRTWLTAATTELLPVSCDGIIKCENMFAVSLLNFCFLFIIVCRPNFCFAIDVLVSATFVHSFVDFFKLLYLLYVRPKLCTCLRPVKLMY